MVSDLYAMGVTKITNMMMLLGISNKMTPKERDCVIPLMMKGFKVSFNKLSYRLDMYLTIYSYLSSRMVLKNQIQLSQVDKQS